ncbi:hypothetical protein SAMN05444483_102157 [Salegentibacter echinorum]|uniref:Glutaminyl-tRNA synthetase n=1 Tax=Salegentibacter echinorum TaxID=1073325 RepID=A0A1M5DYJ3_SALEC|nr:DUF6327 family protein [Salegentibacter echinorum]SHF71882.1 hypothetical protein SAMN05444483_102157 [Salegentibacter echinorum]
MKQYSSYEEIDRDLEILKLQTDIDKEEMKLSLAKTKSAVSPVTIAGNMVGSVLQKALIFKAVAKLTGLKKVMVKR